MTLFIWLNKRQVATIDFESMADWTKTLSALSH